VVILATIIFGLLLHFQFAQAQPIIYKWIDEKGTTHYSEDPNAVPEKYKNKAEKKDIDEFPPLSPDKPRRPQSYSSEPSSKPTQRSRPVQRVESESVDSGPSRGYIPFEKFKYITKGMTEAEVLSRLGSPTREEESEVKSKGTITGHVSPGGALSGGYHGQTHTVKRYYYIGDRSKGEQTRIIIFEKGKVVDYKSITP
jgi:hypothetical protein